MKNISRFARWRRLSTLATLLCLVLLPLPLLAQDVPLNVVEKMLPNGMQILMVERHDKPTVSLYLQFKVGSVDDPKGMTGIAHMLEHMMFKGTKTYGTTNYEAEVPIMAEIDRVHAELQAELDKADSPLEKVDENKVAQLQQRLAKLQQQGNQYVVTDELWQTYQRVGGVGLNASTGDDSTQYFVSLPSNQLELWAMLESDRIANPVFRQFYSERDVVHEERRMRTDTQPEGLLWEDFAATAFEAHPYHNPTVGWASDIDHLTREEVLQYFKTFYAPNNCIAAIVGDINPEKTLAIMEKYFGPIPAQPQPQRHITEEPPQEGERRVVLTMDAQPQVFIGYHTPRLGTGDTFALEAMEQLLSGATRGSRSGRLYKSLVLDKKVAVRVDADSETELYPSLFVITATPAQGKTAADVEQAVYDEIEKIQNQPPSDEEMSRIRNNADASFIRELRSDMGVARNIAYAQYIAGTWKYLLTEREQMKQVTAAQVQAAASKYFGAENRTVAELHQKNAGENGGGSRRTRPSPGGSEVRQ